MRNMKDKMIHIRLPEEILKRFKILCIEKDLSIPKMTTQIIESFCDTMDQNKNFINIKDR